MDDLFSKIDGITSSAALDFIAAQLLDPVAVYNQLGKAHYISPKFLTYVQLSSNTPFLESFAGKTTTDLERLWQRAIEGHPGSFRLGEDGVRCSLHYSPDLHLMFILAKPLTLATQDKELYQAWARVESKWTAIASHSLNLFLEADEAGQILYSTPAIEQVLGYTVNQSLTYYLVDLIHPQDLNDFDLTFRLWVNRIEPVKNGIECRWKTASNDWVYLYVQKLRVDVGQPGGNRVILTAYNITDRKLLEAELQASEQKFRSLVLNMPGAAFRCDASYTMGYISDGIQEISGYPASNFINDRMRSFRSIIHPDDIELIERSIEAAMQDNHAYSLEYRIIHAEGDVRWVSERRQGVFHKGNLLWFDGILLDISDRKQAEAKLRRSVAINRALIQSISDLVLRLSRTGTILSVYPVGKVNALAPFENLFHNKVGQNIADLLPHPLGKQCMTCIERALKIGEIQVEFRVPNTNRMGEARISVIGRNEVLVTVREITDRRRVR
ncbi:MAG TPA: PAS domain S-box protein [Coleofasciculaceae cyanobacterium]